MSDAKHREGITGLVGINFRTGFVVVNSDLDTEILLSLLHQIIAQLKMDGSTRDFKIKSNLK